MDLSLSKLPWYEQVGAFVFRVLNLETNPQFIQVTSPSEVILVATFRLKIGDITGGLTIGYPYLLLEPIIGEFTHRAAVAVRNEPP